MKIVCDNCATKYSIADEKVRGKVFKIRCKKCSHIIVVKGVEGEAAVDTGAPASDGAAENAAPAGDGWHVVINGEQVGPLSPDELRAKFSAGEIDTETFAWKEGFGDWQRLASIDDFSDLAAPAPPASDMTRRTGSDDLFGSGNEATSASNDLFGSPGGDLFAGSARAAAPAPGPAPSAGLFAQPAAAEPARRSSPTPGFGNRAVEDAPATVAAAPAEVGKAMTGQRNENSVLFSLNNLQALASGGSSGPKAQAPSPNAAGIDNRAGFANSQTEGSGLIDIRAMAAATLSTSPSSRSSNSSDLPAFSSAPVFSPIAAPILMPAAASGPPKWVWPLVGLGGLALVAIVVLGVLILNKKPDQVAMIPAAAAPVTAPVPAAPVAPAPGVANTPAVAGTPGAPVAVVEHTGGGKSGTHAAGKPGKGGAAAKPGTKTDAPGVAAAAPEPTAPARKPKKGGDELDDLLNGASPDKPSKHAAAESSSNDDSLPDQLNKSQIVGGMHALNGSVHECFAKFNAPGMVSVAVTIAKSGKVSSASSTGSFAGTPTGDCVARAVKGGSFPQFKGAPQTINYPFVLK